MMKQYTLGIIGCGDFLRTQSDALRNSVRINVRSLYDPLKDRAESFAKTLGGNVIDLPDAILHDPDIDIVGLFVPPWLRKDMIMSAAANNRHILATKPFTSEIDDCYEALGAISAAAGVQCGVIYGRAGSGLWETYKKIFDSGAIGGLALYKHDWLHHYPMWNNWATDPVRNGGPFMDAMIHNMNIAEYLMGAPATKCTFFSDRHAHPDMKCGDTEFMKLDFTSGRSAHLFITWGADLEVYSNEGNYREHIDIKYMVTDQGWRLTDGIVDGVNTISASKLGQKQTWAVERINPSLFDRFAMFLDGDAPWPSDLSTAREAAQDIRIIRTAYKNNGIPFDI